MSDLEQHIGLSWLAMRTDLSEEAECDRYALFAHSRLTNEDDPVVWFSFWQVLQAYRKGHLCVDLREHLNACLFETIDSPRLPLTIEPWVAALQRSAFVSDGSRVAPLVLSGNCFLFLYRSFTCEYTLAHWFKKALEPQALFDEPIAPAAMRDDAPSEPLMHALEAVADRKSVV